MISHICSPAPRREMSYCKEQKSKQESQSQCVKFKFILESMTRFRSGFAPRLAAVRGRAAQRHEVRVVELRVCLGKIEVKVFYFDPLERPVGRARPKPTLRHEFGAKLHLLAPVKLLSSAGVLLLRVQSFVHIVGWHPPEVTVQREVLLRRRRLIYRMSLFLLRNNPLIVTPIQLDRRLFLF